MGAIKLICNFRLCANLLVFIGAMLTDVLKLYHLKQVKCFHLAKCVALMLNMAYFVCSLFCRCKRTSALTPKHRSIKYKAVREQFGRGKK